MKVFAFTGHRPPKLGGYGEPVYSMIYELACKFLAEHRPDKVISGMALGWDTAVAEAALYLGIPLVCACPCESQPTQWPWKDQQKYQAILAQADSVAVVSPGPYAAYKMHLRDQWMVDHCDTLIALWDGSKSGTGTTVRYAAVEMKPVINLWDEFKAMRDKASRHAAAAPWLE